MIQVNIAELKAHLSEYLERVQSGEVVVVARHNRPVAEIRAVAPRRQTSRPRGLAAGEFVVPADFNDPLPEEILDAFEGK